MTFEVIRAKTADVPFVKEIEAAAGLSRWSAEDYRLETKRPDSIFLICRETNSGTVTGYLLARLIISEKTVFETFSSNSIPDDPENFTENDSSIELYNIGVRPEFRRRKIGTLLMARLLSIGLKGQIGEIVLEVRKANSGAIGFYENFGFVRIGERKNFYTNPPDDAVLMRRAPAGEKGV